MIHSQPTNPMTRKLVDSLHVEAMVLSDEARSYFDGFGLADRMDLSPIVRVVFSCEALKVTTRLMHCVAWLLSRRAQPDTSRTNWHQLASLGQATPSDSAVISDLPTEAQRVIAASIDLYARIERLELGLNDTLPSPESPAFHLQQRLERSLLVAVHTSL